MTSQQIRPYIHPLIGDFIQQKSKDFSLIQSQHEGPVHIIFPDIFRENVKVFQDCLEKFETDYKIFFAHKSNKSDAFVFEARQLGIGLEVASLGEFQHVISLGYTGKDIECSGPKSGEYLYLALCHGANICIDSISELETIIKLKKEFHFQNIQILIRINDFAPRDRVLVKKYTKFGIEKNRIIDICGIARENDIEIIGLHFHFDEPNPEVKAGFLDDAIITMQSLYQEGFEPYILNIGGGYRGKEIEDMEQWKDYINFLAEKKSQNDYSYTWGNRAYGIKIGDRGGIEGREALTNRYKDGDISEYLSKMLGKSYEDNIPLVEKINDSMFSLYLESGYALTNNAGLSLIEVIAIKDLRDGRKGVVTNVNIMSLSSRMWEYLLDPLLIKKNSTSEKCKSSYFLMGNLCRDDDLLIQKEVFFDQEVEVGDIICLLDTANYVSDFEEATPIMQATGKKLIAKKHGNAFTLYNDNLTSILGYTKK